MAQLASSDSLSSVTKVDFSRTAIRVKSSFNTTNSDNTTIYKHTFYTKKETIFSSTVEHMC